MKQAIRFELQLHGSDHHGGKCSTVVQFMFECTGIDLWISHNLE